MRSKFILTLLLLIFVFSACGSWIVMNRKFARKAKFHKVDGIWEVGVPRYTALANCVNRDIWDNQNFMIYMPIDQSSKDFNLVHLGQAIDSGLFKIDSVVTMFLASGDEVSSGPYMWDYTSGPGRALMYLQNYKGQNSYPCILFDTLTIPPGEDSIRVEFVVETPEIKKPFSFILHRQEGKKFNLVGH
ncbi:MAG: hypothetical protein GY841_13015 [FCB group bacterium]|nr:hypothetical protein [FCB group bacterium]